MPHPLHALSHQPICCLLLPHFISQAVWLLLLPPHQFKTSTHVLPAPASRSTLWKYMFGRQARDLEQSNTAEDEYMISDSDLFVTKYVSVPREMGHFNPAAFVAGVVRGVLEGAGFPARVTAHYVAVKDQLRPKTVILIKFTGYSAIMQREQRMPGS
jgi:hypothetical protein